MKTLGIIGGVSWHSTAEYYRQLNMLVAHTLGARHSARLVLTSLDFADLLDWQRHPDDSRLREGFLAEGRKLKSAGCDAFIIASHTLSWLGEYVSPLVGLPHINLYQALVGRLEKMGASRVGLMGTRYTMTDPLYRESYEQAGFAVVVPDEPFRSRVARIVYKELVRGVFLPESKLMFSHCFDHLIQRKVDCIILGCTEIGLLVSERRWPTISAPAVAPLPLIDLVETHVAACVEWMQGL